MSVTKLKTVGGWPPVQRPSGSIESETSIRGRVITGLLTGDDAPEAPPIVEDRPEERLR